MKIEKHTLHCASLEEISEVLCKGLSSSFKFVDVQVVDCPDLKEKPYMLSAEGLCGRPCLLDVGGTEYLLPVALKNKIYDLKGITENLKMQDCLIIGSAAGPLSDVGELMANIKFGENAVNNSRIAKIVKEGHELIHFKDNTQFSMLGNFFVSEGKPGKVIKIHAKERMDSEDFVSAIRKTLENHFKDKIVGMGGVFIMKKGKAKMHIVPSFPENPLKTREEVINWLCFVDMSAPLTCLSTIVSHDPGLNLKEEHTHCFSDHNDGGHYDHDITPDVVEYEGYFNIASELYRIDEPTTKHAFE